MEINKENKSALNKENLPTKSQIWKFENMGIKIPKDMTKYEASLIIKEHSSKKIKNKEEVIQNDEFPDY